MQRNHSKDTEPTEQVKSMIPFFHAAKIQKKSEEWRVKSEEFATALTIMNWQFWIMKAAIKRMENDARISYPEREQARTKFNYELLLMR